MRAGSLLSQLLRAPPSVPLPPSELLVLPLHALLLAMVDARAQTALRLLLASAPPPWPGPAPLSSSASALATVCALLARLLSDEHLTGLTHMTLPGTPENQYALVLVALSNEQGADRAVLGARFLADVAAALSDSNAAVAAALFDRAATFPALWRTLNTQLGEYVRQYLDARDEDGFDAYRLSCVLQALGLAGRVPATCLYRSETALSELGLALLRGLASMHALASPAVRRRLLRSAFHLLHTPVSRTPGLWDRLVLDLAEVRAFLRVLLLVYADQLMGSEQAERVNSLLAEDDDDDDEEEEEEEVDEEGEEEGVRALVSVFGGLHSERVYAACLRFFDSDVSRCVDALLSSNLPPSLLLLEDDADDKPSLQSLRRPKDKRQEELYRAPGEEGHSALRESVRAAEARAERDSLIVRREYDDDYDDQFDEALVCAAEPVVASGVGSVGVRWEVKGREVNGSNGFDEIRRYNALLREEEKEVAYWRSMENTNRRVPGKEEEEREERKERGDGAGARPAAGSGGRGRGGEGKPRTKTFDKHRQKDRALRKLG